MHRRTDEQIIMCTNGSIPNITNITNNTNTTCSMDILQGLSYCPVFLFGFTVNAAALHAFFAQRASWTDTHVYMLNLAVADSALVLFLPFRIFDAFSCLPKNLLCTVLLSIHYINMYASILTTAAISVHRYHAISLPLHARSWRKKKEIAFAVCLVFWVLLVSICVAFREENYPDKLWTCYERCKNRPLKSEFVYILFSIGYLAPLLLVLFCSIQIIRILQKLDDESEERKATIAIVTANMIVFIVCYTPIHISFLFNYTETPPPDWQTVTPPAHVFLLVTEWIASTNCCFDSISYYFLLKRKNS